MKKILWTFGTIAAVIIMVPLFAAFEAHVVNVTAKIENALAVSTDSINFGTVFPQEHLEQPLDIRLSQSFLDEDRVDDVGYFIRQKPKCGITSDDGKTLVGETATGHIVLSATSSTGYVIDCGPAPELEEGQAWGVLPSLCPYISKEPDGAPGNDGTLASFHEPFTVASGSIVWTDTKGLLAKSQGDIEDRWTIDLAVPCFGGFCAQDWEDFVHRINPDADPAQFTQPIENEHKIFGCDLWIEVADVSLPPPQIGTATLTVTKVVVNDNSGTATTADFALNVSGTPVVSGVPHAFAAASYTVGEIGLAGYSSVISGDCAVDGTITLVAGDVKACTITNNDNPPETGLLTVTKIVTNDNGGNATISNFTLSVSGLGSVTSGAGNAVASATYTVSELGPSGYEASFSGDCDTDGNVHVGAGESKSCTITNNDIAPNITLVKSVTNNDDGTAGPTDFTLRVNGVIVPSGTSIVVDANFANTIDEDAKAGYSFVSITGDAKCPAVLGGTANLDEGEAITCTITNDDVVAP